jgi:hypothetical protein
MCCSVRERPKRREQLIVQNETRDNAAAEKQQSGAERPRPNKTKRHTEPDQWQRAFRREHAVLGPLIEDMI